MEHWLVVMYRSNTLARLVVVTWLVILDVSHITCRLYRPHVYTMTCVVTICDAYLYLPDISFLARLKQSNISNFVGVLYVLLIVRWYTLSLYRNGIVNAECILEHRRILAKYRSDTVANWCVVIWLVIVDVANITLLSLVYSSTCCPSLLNCSPVSFVLVIEIAYVTFTCYHTGTSTSSSYNYCIPFLLIRRCGSANVLPPFYFRPPSFCRYA